MTYRERLEAMALRTGLAGGLVAAGASYLYNLGHQALPLIAAHSMGTPIVVIAMVLPLGVFQFGYQVGARTEGRPVRRDQPNWRLILDGLSLSIAYSLLIGSLAYLGLSAFNAAFRGLLLDPYIATLIAGLFAGTVAYGLFNLSTNVSSLQVVAVLISFLVTGLFTSMTTNSNPEWWRENFSSLGIPTSNTFFVFNLTLIISGVLMVVLVDYLFRDLGDAIPQSAPSVHGTSVLRVALMLLAASLAGIGAFPFVSSTLLAPLHDVCAYAMVVLFVVIALSISKLVPGFTPSFYSFSRLFGAGQIALLLMYVVVHYLTLTALELLTFLVFAAWLTVFFKAVLDRKRDVADGLLDS